MRGKILENVVMFTRNYLEQSLKEGWRCVDATLGHGNDLLFISDIIGLEGKVYGFDIQKEAIESSKILLEEKSLHNNYELIHAGHEKISDYIKDPVNFIIFNLGYMPKGDKSITTKKTTTLVAVEESLKLLSINGLLWLVVYSGHEAGKVEAEALENYAKGLDQKKYSVMKMQPINQINTPPYILAIEKKF